jgi:hypothetical protein
MKKKQTALTLIIAILFAGFLFSCKKEEVGGFEEYDANIVGKWQVIADLGWVGEPIDYLPYNIIYDFRENNILHVSGEIESIDDYKGHVAGEYSYKTFRHRPSAFQARTESPAGVPPLPSMEIDGEIHTFYFSWFFPNFSEVRTMILSYPKSGGLELVRIEDLAKMNQN